MQDPAPDAPAGEAAVPCWCTLLPPALAVPGVALGCWCAQCLARAIEAAPARQ